METPFPTATGVRGDGCCLLVGAFVPVGIDDGLEARRVLIALERLSGALQPEPARDQRVKINSTASYQMYRRWPGVGVAEDPGHSDLEILDVLDRQGHLR